MSPLACPAWSWGPFPTSPSLPGRKEEAACFAAGHAGHQFLYWGLGQFSLLVLIGINLFIISAVFWRKTRNIISHLNGRDRSKFRMFFFQIFLFRYYLIKFQDIDILPMLSEILHHSKYLHTTKQQFITLLLPFI